MTSIGHRESISTTHGHDDWSSPCVCGRPATQESGLNYRWLDWTLVYVRVMAHRSTSFFVLHPHPSSWCSTVEYYVDQILIVAIQSIPLLSPSQDLHSGWTRLWMQVLDTSSHPVPGPSWPAFSFAGHTCKQSQCFSPP